MAIACLAGSSMAHASEPLTMRVLTWNVWGLPHISSHLESRMRALPDAMARLEPDLILLQELWQKEHGDLVALGLKRHGYQFSSHFAETAEGQTGLFIASRFKLGRGTYRPFAFGRLPHSFWHLDWLVSKGVAEWTVETPLGNMLIENTHLQSQYVTDIYAAERVAQAGELVIFNRANTRTPVILGGDFNGAATDLSRRTLRDVAGFADAAESASLDTVYTRSGHALTLRCRNVRHVLNDSVLLAGGIHTRLSDHSALLVELELSRAADGPSEVFENRAAKQRTVGAMRAAAAAANGRIVRAVLLAIAVLALIVFLRRRPARLWLRIAAFTLLGLGLVWTSYLAAIYYPNYRATLRKVAAELEGSSNLGSVRL